MQWSARTGGGFSEAATHELIRPLIADGPFGYDRLNVDAHRADDDSLLRWLEHVVAVHREHDEIGFGTARILDTGDPAVLAHRCEWEGRWMLALHNFSDEPRTVTLPSEELPNEATEFLGDARYPACDGGRVELGPAGYRWLGAARPEQRAANGPGRLALG
jgi:maltose alpha-D-glucosyltransferase/alpha-amylase